MAAAASRRSCSSPATASSPYFPPDLIPDVASRLTSLRDFFNLRAACRAYRAPLPLTRSNLASQAPLLLVPDDATVSQAVFHLPLRRTHRFRLPRARLTTKFDLIVYSLGCCSVVIDNCSQIRVVHLLTGEQTCLPNPTYDFFRVLLSGDLVLAWDDFESTFEYYCLRTAEWRVASINKPYRLADLISLNGTIFALVTPGCRLAVLQLSDSNNSVELVFLEGELNAETMQLRERPLLCLAECCGELILISHLELDPRIYHVFRWLPGEQKWARITSLGGCTVFLADHRFVGCLGPNHPGIRGDCIYLTEDVETEDIDGVWHEFSLVDGSFAKFVIDYLRGEPSEDLSSPSVWIFPSMC